MVIVPHLHMRGVFHVAARHGMTWPLDTAITWGRCRVNDPRRTGWAILTAVNGCRAANRAGHFGPGPVSGYPFGRRGFHVAPPPVQPPTHDHPGRGIVPLRLAGRSALPLPDHLHCIWTLPPDHGDFATRWWLVKTRFTRHCDPALRALLDRARAAKAQQALWQHRYWGHLLRDEADFSRHVEYIHYSPVKHGYAINRRNPVRGDRRSSWHFCGAASYCD